MPVLDFQIPSFGKEICHHAVGDISIHKGDQAAIQGVTGQTKLIVYNVFDA